MAPTGRLSQHCQTLHPVGRSYFLLAALAAAFLAFSCLAHAQVFKTGQTKCYDVSGTLITCAGTGQDGELQKGVAHSYTDNGDGTVTDNLTGLMWEKLDNATFTANPSDIHDKNNRYTTWNGAFGKIATLNSTMFAGHSDWRLPNFKELDSLIWLAHSAPAVDSAFSNGTDSFTYPTGNYFSSDTVIGLPTFATGVSFTVGGSGVGGPKGSATLFFVRAVRGPVKTPVVPVLKTGQTQCWDSTGTSIACAGTGQDGETQLGASPSYTDNGDGTITDNVTKLIWEKLENLDDTTNSSDLHDADNNYTTWDLAFAKIAALNTANFAGHNDWRMPNIKELQSLVLYNGDVPTIDPIFNNGIDSFTRPNGCWSSTTSLSIPQWAYGLAFQSAVTNVGLSKTNPFANGCVRAVRGGVDSTPPNFTSADTTTFTTLTSGTFTVMANGFPPPSISMTSGTPPSNVTFNPGTGMLSGTPAANTGGTYTLQFTATNGNAPDATQTFTLVVDQPPAITSANTTTFMTLTPGSFTVMATGYPAPSLSLMSGTPPSGVTFNPGNGMLSGTPAANTGGSYTLVFKATNGVSPDALQMFTLIVDQPPAITSANHATFKVGVPASFQVTATGFPAPTFSETGPLPNGVNLNPTTGVLGGTPLQAGIFHISIRATNSVSPDAVQAFTLTVQPGDTSCSVTGPPSRFFSSGQVVTLKATVTPAAGIPTGTVKFLTSTTQSYTLGTVPLNASGTATLNTVLPNGNNYVHVLYSGDANYNSCTSDYIVIWMYQ